MKVEPKLSIAVEIYGKGSRKFLRNLLVGMGLDKKTARTILTRTNRETAVGVFFALRKLLHNGRNEVREEARRLVHEAREEARRGLDQAREEGRQQGRREALTPSAS